MDIVSLMNGIAVGIFGMILSAAFCDILWTRQRRMLFGCSMAAMLLIQGIIYMWIGASLVRHLYPAITHIPLVIVLWILSKKWLWSVIAVMAAYFCCQVRRWLALFVVALASGGQTIQELSELIITLPLLLILVRLVAPSVRFVSQDTNSVQYQFGFIPAVYYVFDYLTKVYASSSGAGAPVIEEFMSFVCSVSYLVFVLRTSQEKWTRNQLEQTQDNLNLQITQAVREIEILRQSQQRASAYRHDLRHHMRYLLSCIKNERLEQAETYIHEICTEIETDKITVFCKNEAVNLIFSAYSERAKDYGISFKIRAEIPENIGISECDLCVLMSNALENALHACQRQRERGKTGTIEVSVFEKKGKLLFEIANSCDEDVSFVNGIPVTTNPGHGIGVRSICTLVERYDGIYTFGVEDERFILRVSI